MGFSKLRAAENKSRYKNTGSIKSLIKYILRDKATGEHVRFYGGTYVDVIDSANTLQQFQAVKKYFKKLNGRQVYHYILSFPQSVSAPEEVYQIGLETVRTFFAGYQTIFSVHEDTDNLHIHIMLNSVSFLDGKKWHINYKEYFALKNEIEMMADAHFSEQILKMLLS